MAYRVGETVIYPHHGAAVIEKTEQRELSGEPRQYLVLRLTSGDLTVMVPSDACEDVGIREVVSRQEVERVLAVLRTPEPPTSATWNRRYKANQERLRSGDIFRVAEVVRNLTVRNRGRSVSAGEKRMLEKAEQILLSELAAAGGWSEEQTRQLVARVLAENAGRPPEEDEHDGDDPSCS